MAQRGRSKLIVDSRQHDNGELDRRDRAERRGAGRSGWPSSFLEGAALVATDSRLRSMDS